MAMLCILLYKRSSENRPAWWVGSLFLDDCAEGVHLGLRICVYFNDYFPDDQISC
jgi:hypothetical protein